MAEHSSQDYRDLAEAAWRWVLDHVRWDDGPWVPVSVTDPAVTEPAWDRDGMHSGVGGLALLLAEIRGTRSWTPEEQSLAEAIAERARRSISETTDCTFFDGLVSTIGVLTAIDATGADAAVARLLELAAPDGWPQTVAVPPKTLPDARINDITLGTGGVLLGALWARRAGVAGARELAERAATVLMAEREDLPTGTDWAFVPRRFLSEAGARMPNLSHGLAGIAAALAVAGTDLDRPDLVEAARSGAEHLVTLADTNDGGFVVPRQIPVPGHLDPVTFTWCHGPTGTSLLFRALDGAGVADVAGEPPLAWHRRCLHSVRTSGLPARVRPGFWDNDGRCCGTAGVGDVFLDSWHRSGAEGDREFALQLADTLVEGAVRDGPHAYWRFIEHTADEPLLPPGVGWMQGACGIAAFLLHADRVVQQGADAEPVRRIDNWWALG